MKQNPIHISLCLFIDLLKLTWKEQVGMNEDST